MDDIGSRVESAGSEISALFLNPKLKLEFEHFAPKNLERGNSIVPPSNLIVRDDKQIFLISSSESTQQEITVEMLHAYYEHYNPSVKRFRTGLEKQEARMGGLNKKLRSNKIKGEDAAKQWANYLNSGLVFIVGYFALEAAFEEYRDVVQGKRPTTPGLGFEVRKKEGHSDKDVMFDAMKEAIQFFNDENKIYVSIEDLCDTGCDIVEMLKTKLQAATALGKMFGYRLFWDLEKGAEPEITGKADSSTCQCKVIFPYSKRATETAKGLLVQYFQMDMQDLANNAKKAIYKERTNILSAMNEF